MIRLPIAQFFFFLISISGCGKAQEPGTAHLVGGACEGCEAVFEYGDRPLRAVDTLPDFWRPGRQIQVHGTVYQADGRTPAEGVVLYVYHTNQEGIYEPAENARGWARQHGEIRGWMKTDRTGYYAFYTLQPGAYPNGSEPAHIHLIVLEPNGKYYWLRSYHFAGDPQLTPEETRPESPRGGSAALLSLQREEEHWIGSRDIVLGKNIPGY